MARTDLFVRAFLCLAVWPFAACGSDSVPSGGASAPPAATPGQEPEPTAPSPSPEPVPAPAPTPTAAPEAAKPAAALPTGSVGSALSGARSVRLRTVLARPRKSAVLRGPAEITALIAAIGADQRPGKALPKCVPQVTADFLDRSGAVLGSASFFCGDEVRAPATFRPAGGALGSITLAHPPAIEAALEKAGLRSPPTAPPEPAPESRCGTGGTPIADGNWHRCTGYVGGACCYQTAEQACSGAGCASGRCAMQKSRPPKAHCSGG